jgi:hypothetical protein
VAGTTVFITDTVAHPQYISGNKQKNELGSLDFLYNHLISEVFNDKIYFDFGPSNEENGQKINEGILFWKERLEFIFIALMALLLIYLFNPRRDRNVIIDYETKLLLYLFGFILLITAKWGDFIHENPLFKKFQKIV